MGEMKRDNLKIGQKFFGRKNIELSRTVTKIEYHDWLNELIVHYSDQGGKKSSCTFPNFKGWAQKSVAA
jgi:hypothetical protein